MSETNAAVPDARHLIWVARNLLWQAHEAFKDEVKVFNSEVATSRAVTRNVICGNLRTAIESVDQVHERLKDHAPIPCKNTTMPPCTDNAWRHFLEHVQACYLPRDAQCQQN